MAGGGSSRGSADVISDPQNPGLDKVVITNAAGDSVAVFLHGAHVASWKTKDGDELLFVSKEAIFKPGKAIRGGIPIIFPQFSDLGPLQAHGFARTHTWTLCTSSPSSTSDAAEDIANADAFAELELRGSDAGEPPLLIWPGHRFVAKLRVELHPCGSLTLKFHVINDGDNPLTFTFALHTYFHVSDISTVHVDGLQGTEYLDNLKGRQQLKDAQVQGSNPAAGRAKDGQDAGIHFQGEFDRIYLNTPNGLSIVDQGTNRTILIHKEGLPDAVVWNPWIEKSKKMADFGDEEYKVMVCVEAAAIEKPIVVPAGATWTASQTVKMVDS